MATLTYRIFRNTDPPTLVNLWQSCAGPMGLVQPVSPDLLEQLVFAKLYFERAGLFLAFDDNRPVGFAHAGFGANEAGSALAADVGVTSLILVQPDYEAADEAAAGLLAQCEDYLRSHGAKTLYGGGTLARGPFYFGLYGGSELPGVRDSDAREQRLYRTHGYEASEPVVLYHRDLSGFESLIDRQQMQIRRQMVVQVTNDARPKSWWDALALGTFDLTRFGLMARNSGTVVASAVFRSMQPSVTNAMSRATGLLHFWVEPTCRGRGIANFLLSEAFRQFMRQGTMLVDAQVSAADEPAHAVMRKLGFQEVDRGWVFQKPA